jgi:hypothetical protein
VARDYAFWLLGSTEPTPLVVIANASDGPWVRELDPQHIPDPPIQFFRVRDGTFGPVLQPAGLVLFRRDLLAALRGLPVGEFLAFRATIRAPQSDATIDDYSVIKVPRSIPLASLTTPAGRPALRVLREAIDAVLVSNELRGLLQTSGVHGLSFSEPLFAGGPPAA